MSGWHIFQSLYLSGFSRIGILKNPLELKRKEFGPDAKIRRDIGEEQD